MLRILGGILVGAGLFLLMEPGLKTSPSGAIYREIRCASGFTQILQLKNEHPPNDLKGFMTDWASRG